MLGFLRRALRKLESRDAAPEPEPDELTTRWPPVPAGDVDPFRAGLGISASAIAEAYRAGDEPSPYVEREIDPELDEALASRRFVLLTGAPKAGKSRTALAAAARMDPRCLLVVPASPAALPALLAGDHPPDEDGRPAVLWLDRFDHYLVLPQLRRELFDNLGSRTPRTVVLATMTLRRRAALAGTTGEIGRSIRQILDLAYELTLPSELTPAEQERASGLYPGRDVTGSLGEHFTSTRELVSRFGSSIEEDPHGVAVVVAALDWKRAGAGRPIQEADLRELYPPYLERRRPAEEATAETFRTALA